MASITPLAKPALDILVRPTTAEELVARWPFLRARLQEIKDEQGPRATWTPSHVRHALVTGAAELWFVWSRSVMYKDDLPLAFAITQTIVDPCLHVPVGLYFWFLWKNSAAPKRAITDAMHAHFEQVARDRGLNYLEGTTTWPGLAERMHDAGWETVGYIIRKEVV